MTHRRHPETADHRAVIQHIAWRGRPGVFAFHCPNGGWRSRVEGAILKAMGTVAGVPDIIIIHGGHCFGLELKAEGGRLTPAQIATHEAMRATGATVATAVGLDAALRQLEEWSLLRVSSSGARRDAKT
jgi:hypothetical protein